MPSITGTPAVVDLVDALQEDLTAGRAARATLGARDTAFGWTTDMPSIIAPHVTTGVSEGKSFDVVKVAPSGVLGPTLPGGTKPTWATLSTETVPIGKYAGLVGYNVEAQLHSVGLGAAVTEVLVNQALRSYDIAVWPLLGSDAGLTADGASWSSAILAGVAKVAAAGGMPDRLIMSPTDYAAAVESPGAGYLLDPRDGVQTLFGLRLVVSTGAEDSTGTAYVASSSAVVCVEDRRSPAVLVDPLSGMETNLVRVAAEVFAGAVVVRPGAVCAVSVTGGAARRQGQVETPGGVREPTAGMNPHGVGRRHPLRRPTRWGRQLSTGRPRWHCQGVAFRSGKAKRPRSSA